MDERIRVKTMQKRHGARNLINLVIIYFKFRYKIALNSRCIFLHISHILGIDLALLCIRNPTVASWSPAAQSGGPERQEAAVSCLTVQRRCVLCKVQYCPKHSTIAQ